MNDALRRQNLKPKKHYDVSGKPDFAFPRDKVAVFCDSHFWHGYKWATNMRLRGIWPANASIRKRAHGYWQGLNGWNSRVRSDECYPPVTPTHRLEQ